MNIEILHDHINEFKHEIIDSGFKRDIDDYTSSLPSVKNNIVSPRVMTSNYLPSQCHPKKMDTKTLVRELIMYSQEARSKLRSLPPADRQLLIDKYDAAPQEKKETKEAKKTE
jgi:hypothetical protein